MAKRLTKDERGRVAEKIMEWGNLVFAGLVIGQFISGSGVNYVLTFFGIMGMAVGYVGAVLLMKRR